MTENQTPKYRMAETAILAPIMELEARPMDPVIARELAIVKRKIRDSEEPLLKANPNRYVIFPIEH